MWNTLKISVLLGIILMAISGSGYYWVKKHKSIDLNELVERVKKAIAESGTKKKPTTKKGDTEKGDDKPSKS